MAYSTGVAGTNISIANGAGYQTYSASGVSIVQSFLPILTFGGGSTGMTYTTQQGHYQQLTNNLIYCTGQIQLSAMGSSVGIAKVSLPHSSSNTYTSSMFVIYIFNLFNTLGGDVIGLQVDTNAATATIAITSGTSSNALTSSDFTNTTNIYYSGSFFI